MLGIQYSCYGKRQFLKRIQYNNRSTSTKLYICIYEQRKAKKEYVCSVYSKRLDFEEEEERREEVCI